MIIVTEDRAIETKDPDAILEYGFDWTAWLAKNAQPTDAIATHEILAVGCTSVASSLNGNLVTARISGGVVGVPGSVTCRITTDDGLSDDRTLNLKFKQN